MSGLQPQRHLAQTLFGHQAAISLRYGKLHMITIAEQQGAILLQDAVVAAQGQRAGLLEVKAAPVGEGRQH
ncbi:hypothetical protein D3C80_1599520 [compost metagenome]